MAVAAQFLYVAAQAGISSFFINYMTSQTPVIPAAWNTGWFGHLLKTGADGARILPDRGAATMASVGTLCFLIGRFSGAAISKKCAVYLVHGLYGALNVLICLLIFLKLG